MLIWSVNFSLDAVNAQAIYNILLQMDSENTFTGATDVIVDGYVLLTLKFNITTDYVF